MYALTTHTSEVSVKPRSAAIDGKATFTIVVSSTIMSTPRHRTISANQRLLPWMEWVMQGLLCRGLSSGSGLKQAQAGTSGCNRMPDVPPLGTKSKPGRQPVDGNGDF